MFRRFMVVCWVLFSLLALTGAAGWYFVFEADPKREIALAEYQSLKDEKIDFAALLQAAELSDGEIDESDLSEDELKSIARAEAQSEKRDAAKNRLSAINKEIDSWAGAIVYGSFGAAFMLLWNIIWHIGHWIWMGRKAER